MLQQQQILLAIGIVLIVAFIGYNFEKFQNDDFYSYSQVQLAKYAQAELLNDEKLVGGIAKRYVKDNNVEFNISANLYLLNGNVFGPLKEQSYVAILDDNTTQMELGELKNYGDQVYKLNLKTNADVLKYNNIKIVWKHDGEQQVLVQGYFK